MRNESEGFSSTDQMRNQAKTPSFNTQQSRLNTNGSGSVKLEIPGDNATASGSSLADAFRLKKQQLMQGRDGNEPESKKEGKREKTKEELAEIRRQMMKRPSAKNSIEQSSQQQSIDSQEPARPQKQDSPKSKMLSRLAKGEKTEVSKKDMLKLTSKNYELLPEVKKKKEEERKKEELRDRMKQVKELEKQRRELMSKQGSRK